MLLVSHRHRNEDLALWAEMEAADLIHAGTPGFLRKVDAAKHCLGSVTVPHYVSVSWGKDSTVLAHLVWELLHKSPTYRVRMERIEPAEETDRVEAAFLEQFPLPGYVRVESDYIDGERPLHMSREPALVRGIMECQRLSGSRRYINGLRASESRVRWFRMLRGASLPSSVSPLAWWTDQDVFAYLASHNLPVHANYAMLGGGRWSRDRLRVCMIGGTKGTGGGRAEWEQEYYGDVLHRLRASQA